MTVSEDMDRAAAEKYVFQRFRWRLSEVLQDTYLVAAKEGKIKYARKWLNEQEPVDSPQVAARIWGVIKVHHDRREIRLRDWRNLRGQYILFCWNAEDWNEGDEQSRLLNLLPAAWIKRVTKAEAERAKSNHSVKIRLDKGHHKRVVSWTRAKVAGDFKRQFPSNALLITVSGDCEKTAIWRLEGCEVGGDTICLQTTPARMSCNDVQ